MRKFFFYATAVITLVVMALLLVGIVYLTWKPLTDPFAYHSIGIIALSGVAALTCGFAALVFRCVEETKEKGE